MTETRRTAYGGRTTRIRRPELRGKLITEMPAVLHGTLKHPKHEPLLEGAAERIHAAVRQLKERGIIDEKGSRVRTDLPEDMKPGADRDFGG